LTEKPFFGYNITSLEKQEQMMCQQAMILSAVIQQIEQDLRQGQSDAVYALLMSVSTDQLVEFLLPKTQQFLAVVDQ